MHKLWRTLATIAAALLAGALWAAPAFAQALGTNDLFGGQQPSTFAQLTGLGSGDLRLIIASLIRTFLGTLGIIAVLLVLYGGFLYMTSQGEKAKVDKAKRVIINAVIGLTIILSSFIIVQFILSALVTSINGGVNSSSSGGGGYDDTGGGTASTFVLNSVNTDCASTIRNLELQFVFNRLVDHTTISASSIKIGLSNGSDDNAMGALVAGTFFPSASGPGNATRVTFKPTATCTATDGSTVSCFDPGNYEILLDSATLKSADGKTLACTTANPCHFDFTIGTGFDTAPPTMTMQSPDDGQSVYSGDDQLLQVKAEDDGGVSSVDFFLNGDVISSAGLDGSDSATVVPLPGSNNFYGDWDTNGYVTNQSYDITARGYDCAGNSTLSDTVSPWLRVSSCGNGVQDGAETGIDCGGDSSSAAYCGACSGGACSTDGDCASGSCISGVCVDTPRIDEVSAGDGAYGNYVTISGSDFGSDSAATVTFLGADTDGDGNPAGDADDVTASLPSDSGCTDTWDNSHIVIQLASPMVDGPIEVKNNTTGYADRTDDDVGPRISDFDINDTVRPGLCFLDPSSSTTNEDTVTVHGNNFGANQGSSTLYFGTTLASSYPFWSSGGNYIQAAAPLLNSGTYDVQMFVGDGAAREGSNKLPYSISTTASATPPVISDVDSGVSRCFVGTTGEGSGTICASDSDCASGETCTEAKTSGPIGQYVSIYGSNFGDTIGSVTFTSADGTNTLADTSFPDFCTTDYWHDTEITVKVPTGLSPGTYQLWLTRHDDNATSDPTQAGFIVISGKAGPSICAITPSGGPAGTPVDIKGEGFGATRGSGGKVTFSTAQDVIPASWADTEVTGTNVVPMEVPTDAVTGHVVVDHGGYTSNSVNFTVGTCNVDFSCSASETCCSNGSCVDSGLGCPETVPQDSFYSYYFSTDEIPQTPDLAYGCSDAIISPTPYENWDGGTSVCVTPIALGMAFVASGTATPMSMSAASFTNETVLLDKCTTNDCSSTTPVTLTRATQLHPKTGNTTAVTWDLPTLDVGSRYRVTIKGGTTGIKNSAGVTMAQDRSWEFVTSASDAACTVGGAYITPSSYTATAPYDPTDDTTIANTVVTYNASPIAAESQCLILACAGSSTATYDWSFTSNDETKATIADPGPGVCSSDAHPLAETDPSTPDIITAALSDYGVSDDAQLNINFTDPEVTAFAPSCEEACLNAAVTATFNVSMVDDFSGYTSGIHNVRLMKCQDQTCAEEELSEVTPRKVTYATTTKTLTITKTDGSGHPVDLDADSWYRVIISGDLASETGVALSKALSSDLNFNGDVSWTFQTKDSECTVSRVDVSPATATLSVVGDRQQFDALPYGSPDGCSATGEQLTATDFTWNTWNSSDTNVGVLLDSGAIELSPDLPAWCASSCLVTGSSSPIAVCGNGIKEDGEDCDDSNTLSGDGCSSTCLDEGASTSYTPAAHRSTCGDGVVGYGEECDDRNTADGDGCSSKCLNEGSVAAHVDCGNGHVDQAASLGGEDCDFGSDNAAHNCSSNCLNLGSGSGYAAICGNGVRENGEACDDGASNGTAGDGCTTSCLHVGTSVCATSASASCCGNSTIDPGEDCDDGNPTSGDGCSSSCLAEGSDYHDATPSICSDGNQVSPSETCDATTDGSVTASFGVAEIATTAPTVVSASGTDTASTTVTASTGSITGSATLSLQCSCTTDSTCDATQSTTGTSLGCGTGNCCYPRPEETEANPVGSGACRNSAVYMDFDESMDGNSFSETDATSGATATNYYLDLISVNGASIDTCPSPYTEVALAAPTLDAHAGRFALVWQWVWDGVAGLFGRAEAASAAVICRVPVHYAVDPVSTKNAAGVTVTGSRAYLQYDDLLVPKGKYRITAVGEDSTATDGNVDGVASTSGVALRTTTTATFTVGTAVCTLDQLTVEDEGKTPLTSSLDDPSIGLFTKRGEQHNLLVTPQTIRSGSPETIAETSSYNWTYSWGTSIVDTATNNVVSDVDADATSSLATAGNANGSETAFATAHIDKGLCSGGTHDQEACISDADCGGGSCSTGTDVTGTLDLEAILCSNPWPSTATGHKYPFSDTAGDPSADGSPYSGFSFSYCRDLASSQCVGGASDGQSCTTSADCAGGTCSTTLPGMNIVHVPTSPAPTAIKEFLFTVQGTSDAIGVRVFTNPDYLSPAAWFAEQGFAGTPSPTTVDGYAAVKVGDTYYVSAANQTSVTLYPDIYVLSFSENASTTASQIFSQIIGDFAFNANKTTVSNINLCTTSSGTAYPKDRDGNYLTCSWGGDCWSLCKNAAGYSSTACTSDADCDSTQGETCQATSYTCDARKAKIQRDLQRLTDMRSMMTDLAAYGATHRHCSVTKTESCTVDANCPGTETCLSEVPTLDSGSFLRAMTTSAWPSWTAVLSNDLGTTLPDDPLNEFNFCPAGADSTTCFNATAGTFSCDARSHAYIYQSIGGEAYQLYTQLEYIRADWAYSLEDSTDNGTVDIEYAKSNSPTGFYAGGKICTNTPIGASGLCGDGVIGGSEACEIGQSESISCASSGGTITVACKSDCSGFQTETEAETAGAVCVPYACGNGVKDPGETCDDGSLNGTYGHCGENCDLTGAFYCGDGSIAGNEQCDLGSDNGQYVADYNNSCAFDCTFPGPSCGDGEVNGTEQCDGSNQTTTGAICDGGTNDGNTCTTSADCSGGTCGASGSNAFYDACPISYVCAAGDHKGEACTRNSDCKDTDGTTETCDKSFTYQTTRYRICDDDASTGSPSCTYNGTTNPGGWTVCSAGSQVCGDGTREGTEECDDGNSSNDDTCTNACKLNVCGDGYTYTGVESCDKGSSNGTACTPDYGTTCSYCGYACTYQLVSGAYCGDGIKNGDEFCDGTDVPKYCFKSGTTPDARSIGGTCSTDSDCTSGYTCTANIGVCNGGTTSSGGYDWNGEPCVHSNSDTGKRCGDDYSGRCIQEACGSDCQAACPFTLSQSALTITSELPGATAQTSVDLYSYLSGSSPDTASLEIPSCNIGTAITADVSMDGVTPPSVDIVFVTDLSGSMNYSVDGTDLSPPSGQSRIDYVTDSMTTGIKDLFAAYVGSSAQMRIATESFQGSSASTDHTLAASGSESEILYDSTSGVETYPSRATGGTPTATALTTAGTILSSSSAENKIVILLSDGDPSESVASVVAARDALIAGGVKVYTAAITDDPTLEGYMKHFSSDTCGSSTSNPADCVANNNVEYAYAASSADELASVYTTIINSILGVTVGFTTEVSGTATLTSDVVTPGNDVVLPFPAGFDCNPSGTTAIPMRLSFSGTGTVNISNIKLTYCPAD